jgi:predicted nucleic acid-binding Zn ribbon protein
LRSDTACPGCGARNAPDSRVCEWCGRPFLLRDQRRPQRALWVLVALISILAVAALAAIALFSMPSIPSRGTVQAPVSSPSAEPIDEPPTAVPPSPVPQPEPTSEPIEYVRVANTGGLGIVLRREPNTTAARVVARAENAVLRVVGPDQLVSGRVWRQVEDAQGNRGWTPAEFLSPAAPPGG